MALFNKKQNKSIEKQNKEFIKKFLPGKSGLSVTVSDEAFDKYLKEVKEIDVKSELLTEDVAIDFFQYCLDHKNEKAKKYHMLTYKSTAQNILRISKQNNPELFETFANIWDTFFADEIAQTKQAKEDALEEKETKLTNKFGVDFHGKKWVEVTLEERRHGTFSNDERRDVTTGYVIIEDDHLNIVKESVFIKSKMGVKKIYYDNIANIDFDGRGKFHVTNQLVIYMKSNEEIVLKHVFANELQSIYDVYNEFMANRNQPAASVVSGADEIKKYHELMVAGIITEEEFDAKKKELL